MTHNARYYFKVRAKDLKGNWSNYSTVVYAIAKDQVAPASPVGLAAAPSDKSAIISWTANAESDIAGYQLEYKAEGAAYWTIKTFTSTATSTTIGSLSNGGNYQFRLKAKDSAGNFSGYTDTVTCVPDL
ncbi:fibronectin type III domain-containing protein [Dehalobacter sp. TBBPA1]|uniref:fibronectin type III domain-containing protein n=1 Tax=Dehalobacter sp. TBBPA1 TaxID=3235037 RepID=UPI0034A3D372